MDEKTKAGELHARSGGIGVVDEKLKVEDKKVVEDWYRVLVSDEKKFQDKFRCFLGDDLDGTPGHSHRMLAYFAGLDKDRQRLIVMHGWQIHDNICNTGRANASEWDWRYGLSVALALPALVFAIEQEWIMVGAYLGGVVFFLFRPIWRKYFPKRDD